MQRLGVLLSFTFFLVALSRLRAALGVPASKKLASARGSPRAIWGFVAPQLWGACLSHHRLAADGR